MTLLVSFSLLTLSEHKNSCVVLQKLANVYVLNRQFNDALSTYHTILSINSDHQGAKSGLDRLDKIMRGEDPDDTAEDIDPDETGDGGSGF